jgi:hypothetical protein
MDWNAALDLMATGTAEVAAQTVAMVANNLRS